MKKEKSNRKTIVFILLLIIIILLLLLRSCSKSQIKEEPSENTVSNTTQVENDIKIDENKKEETVKEEVSVEIPEENKEEVNIEELSYWVNFLNEDGTSLQRTAYKYGQMPSFNGETPTYENGSWKYYFVGWDQELSKVYGTQTYRAVYDKYYCPEVKEVEKVTLTINPQSGTYVDGKTSFQIEKGSIITVYGPTIYVNGNSIATINGQFLFVVYVNNSVQIQEGDELIANDDIVIETFAFTCVKKGTMITLADGSQKKVENITLQDKLLTFNFYSGKLDSNYPMYIVEHKNVVSAIINITLENGTSLQMSDWQCFFDTDSRDYFDIDYRNYRDSIGRNIMYVENGVVKNLKIVDASLNIEECDSYEIFTEYNKNFIANGILTLEPETWLKGVYTINEDLKIDQEKYLQDVQTYGLYTFDEFADVVSKENFKKLNIADKKISVGKGLTDEKWLFDLYHEYTYLD